MSRKKVLMSASAAAVVASAFVATEDVSAASYKVSEGDSLWKIAQAQGVSVADLKKWNNLTHELVFPNQVLQVMKPVDKANFNKEESNVEKTKSDTKTHIVNSGDTLSEIAFANNISVKNLMELNNLNSTLIFPGNVLSVAETKSDESIHTIAAGETLSHLALKYGTTAQTIADLNNMKLGDIIYVGDTLTIDGKSNSKTEAKVEEKPKVSAQVESKPKTEATEKVEVDKKSVSVTKSDSEQVKTETQPKANEQTASVDSDDVNDETMQVKVKDEPKSETTSKTKVNEEPKPEAISEPEVDEEPKPETISEPEVNEEPKPEVASETEVNEEPKPESTPEPKADEEKTETDVAKSTEDQADIDAANAAEKQAETDAANAAEKKAETYAANAAEKKAETDAANAAEKKAETDAANAAEKKAETDAANAAEKKAESNTAKGSTYVVKSGDTLSKVASAYGTTATKIASLSGISQSDMLQVGDKLTVDGEVSSKPEVKPKPEAKPEAVKPETKPKAESKPKPEAKPDKNASTYVVKSGDTLAAIASAHGTTAQKIASNSGISTNTVLHIGDKLSVNGEAVNNSTSNSSPVENTNNKPKPESKPEPTPKPQANAGFSANQLMNSANSVMGTKYVWGGTTQSGGFDCSGFIHWAYNDAGKEMARTSTDGYYDRSYHINKSELQVGDLVFFSGTYRPGISHMGIYAGNNEFKHAATSTGVATTSLDNPYWSKHFDSFKRFY